MTSTVYDVISKKWNRKIPHKIYFDFTTNMLVIEKKVEKNYKEKRFPCSVVSVVVTKDELAVKISVDTKQYTKEVTFSKKYEVKNFTTLLGRLQSSRGTAYRVFSEQRGEKSVLDLKSLSAAIKATNIKVPDRSLPKSESVTFEEFLELYVKYGPKEQALGQSSPDAQQPISRRRRRRVLEGRTRSMTSLPSTEMLSGESQIVRPSNVSLMLSENEMRAGLLTLTNYRILFQENLTLESLSIPVSTIGTVDTKKRGKMRDLSISCKDFRRVIFVYDASTAPQNVLYQSVRMIAFPESQEKLFAFAHKLDEKDIVDRRLCGVRNVASHEKEEAKAANDSESTQSKNPLSSSSSPPSVDGWSLYDAKAEYDRMRMLDKANYLRLTEKNLDYKFSPTYPSRIVVPANITDEQLDKIGKFRSRARIPAVVYIDPVTKAIIARSAQPMGGIQGTRCKEDETYVNTLRIINPNKTKYVYLFDARPKYAALGNKAMGKGFENVNNYDKAQIEFFAIDNIHAVRTSMEQLMNLCLTNENLDMAEWHTKLFQSKWLHHVRQILIGAKRVAECVKIDRASCLVHCSDGWDRTAQLTSLAQIILDPFYRTIKGFAVLIEKEWVSFGHQFEERIGHGHAEVHDQRSPVFIQFIDCVWQMLRQSPLSFEFTEEFLVSVLDHVYDCRFGTFLFNFESQRRKARYKEKTESLWSFLLAPKQSDIYVNYLYQYCDHKETQKMLQVSSDSRRIVLWEAYHMRYSKEFFECSVTPAVAAMQHSSQAHSRKKYMSVSKSHVQRTCSVIEKESGEAKQEHSKTESLIVITDCTEETTSPDPAASTSSLPKKEVDEAVIDNLPPPPPPPQVSMGDNITEL
mmetsp:Transcript_40013/g.65071  ORF Transcript_40013/g.65071 Transcript_40013/m.65071 type:complete len:859 (+) Transcript_40013:103-2679(+)